MRWMILGAVCALCVGWVLVEGLEPAESKEKEGKGVSRAPIDVRIDAKGLVRVTRTDADGKVRTLAQGSLGSGKVDTTAKLLHAVQKALQSETASPALREPDGASGLTVAYELDAETPWQYVQWMMQTGAHPHVKLYKQSFRVHGATQVTAVDLPKDRGLRPIETMPKPTLKLRVFRKNKTATSEAFTRVRIGKDKRDTFDLPKTADKDHDRTYAAVLTTIRARLKKHLAGGTFQTERAEIAAMPPDGGAVPYRDISRLMAELRAVGFKQLLFEGAAPPYLNRR